MVFKAMLYLRNDEQSISQSAQSNVFVFFFYLQTTAMVSNARSTKSMPRRAKTNKPAHLLRQKDLQYQPKSQFHTYLHFSTSSIFMYTLCS